MFDRRVFVRATAGLTLSGATGPLAAKSGNADVSRLKAKMKGRLITPDSLEYEQRRRSNSFNPRTEKRPLAIAVCADDADIARAIEFARADALDLAVRAGGHDLQGASMSDGIIIDLRALRDLEASAERQTVRVGAGLLAGDLNAPLRERGVAAALGCDHRVGVTGVTLGGGMGWLAGKHGAACDNVVAARLVTADGRVLQASAEKNPELFWALKGGSGNFGVVTELTLATHPIGDVVQGIIVYPGRIADFMRFFREFVATKPEMDFEVFLIPQKDLGPTIFAKVCYWGDAARADAAFAPLLAFGPPIAESIAKSPYTGGIDPAGPIAPLFAYPTLPRAEDDTPGLHVAGTSLAPIGDAALDVIAGRIAEAPDIWNFGFGYLVHGAAAAFSPDGTAWPRIPGQISVFFSTNWRRAEAAEAKMAWVDQSIAALRPHASRTYINFISSTDPALVRAAYGDNYERLRRLKGRLDPENVFRRNRNIPPA